MSSRYPMFLFVASLIVGCQQKQPELPADKDELADVRVSSLYIDRCLKRLEEEKDLTSDRAASIVTAAERTLPVFWGADPDALPADLKTKIDHYPKQIREWFDKINEAKSQILLAEIKAINSEVASWRADNKDENWQAWIEKTQEAVQEIQERALSMSNGHSRKSALKITLDQQALLNSYMRGQYTAYQKKAIAHCGEFVTFALSNTVRSDEPLKRSFGDNLIHEIDSSLLGAEARRIYDVANSQMEDRLKSRARAEFLLNLTNPEQRRWKLSDF